MIPLSASSTKLPDWQIELARSFTKVDALIKHLELPTELFENALAASNQFQLRAPRPFVSRIKKGDINDPLLRQLLPQDIELDDTIGFSHDPVGDLDAHKDAGLIHKYHGRALLITTGSCAINCRYCFRRHFPYQDAQASRDDWQHVVSQLRADTSIEELILSGGDPLILSDRRLQSLVEQVADIPHIKRLRIHSRLALVLPSRITSELCLALDSRLQVIMVIHCNHAQEIDEQVAAALNRLQQANIRLFNQAVLLKGVNDNLDIQIALQKRLFEHNVIPYYLHLLDRVQGAAHFLVSDDDALELMQGLRCQLPGYMVPKLVREVAGAPFKTPIY